MLLLVLSFFIYFRISEFSSASAPALSTWPPPNAILFSCYTTDFPYATSDRGYPIYWAPSSSVFRVEVLKESPLGLIRVFHSLNRNGGGVLGVLLTVADTLVSSPLLGQHHADEQAEDKMEPHWEEDKGSKNSSNERADLKERVGLAK